MTGQNGMTMVSLVRVWLHIFSCAEFYILFQNFSEIEKNVSLNRFYKADKNASPRLRCTGYYSV